jgi:ribosomal protein S18 acetylase RimI-like enzyme
MTVQTPTTSISPFVIQAYDEVYALWQNCAGVGLSSADSKESIAAYLVRNPGMSFIARDGEKIIGAILCGHDGRRGYIHHLAVRESHRRQGIGRHLVDHALAALQKEGIQKCHLFIFHENESGIAFWQSAGWTFRHDIRVMSIQIREGNK